MFNKINKSEDNSIVECSANLALLYEKVDSIDHLLRMVNELNDEDNDNDEDSTFVSR